MRTLIKDIIKNEGKKVQLFGWLNVRRDHGKIIFIDLRDRTGLVQVVFTPDDKELYELADSLRSEWVLEIHGRVGKRPDKMKNANLETGDYEVQAEELIILNKAGTTPFPIDTDGYEIDEELRLEYRYLDLRRKRLQRNIKLRSEFVKHSREFLFSRDFLEIETPLLTKSTPEGSRDFIVPSRLHPGKFFALPQSPQQYKQLLMVGGFERYFQIAKCVRDEDLRSDRGFEHTQIDIEMSFTEREEFMKLDEEMMITVVEAMGYKVQNTPFPVFTYQESLQKFGSDKFDLRNKDEKKSGVLAFAWVVDFPFFGLKNKNSPSGENSEWTFTHNPFSSPKPEHEEWLLNGKNIDKIITSQYDLVCNGFEVGGGSIRAHKPEVLRAVFRILGYSDKKINEEFGHILKALSFGAPPHGGIAHGIERLLMCLTNEEYLREVQAFPQTSSGRTSVMEAPSDLDKSQLDELGITVAKKKK